MKHLICILLLATPAFAAGPNPVPNAKISGSSTLDGILYNSGMITGGTMNADVLQIGGVGTSGLFDSIGAAAAAQAYSIQRANHTGTQPASTISDFSATVLSSTAAYALASGSLTGAGSAAYHAASDFATSDQGALAQTALQSAISTVSGSGSFTITTSASNGVLTIGGSVPWRTGQLVNDTGFITSSGTAAALPGFVNVKTYGAVGDGTTDDTAAIQAAINTKKNVYFPTGTYKLSAALVPNPNKTVVSTGGQMFFGDGPQNTILWQTTGTADVFNTPDESMYFIWRDMHMKGPGADTSTGAGIHHSTSSGWSNQWQVQNVDFRALGYGIRGNMEDTLISNCQFDTMRIGVWVETNGITSPNNITIQGCSFILQNGGSHPPVPMIGLRLDAGNGYKIMGLDIGNAGMSTAIQLNGGTIGVIEGVSCEMNPTTGGTTAVIDASNAGYSYWTVAGSNFGGFGSMNAVDYPIIVGGHVTIHVASTSFSGSWKNSNVKWLHSPDGNNTVTANSPLSVDHYAVISGSMQKVGTTNSQFNALCHAFSPLASSSTTVGRTLLYPHQGSKDDELLYYVQTGGSNSYAVDNLNQYNTDVRSGGIINICGAVPVSLTSATFSASSTYSTYSAALAFDGDVNTYWYSNGAQAGQWLKTDFGSGNAVAIDRFTVNFQGASYTFGWLQGSNDNSTWVNVIPFVGYQTNTTLSFSANNTTAYRYYRIYFTGGEAAWMKMNEVAFYSRGLVLPSTTPPTSATSAGITGQTAWDASYFYWCTGTNTWVRASGTVW